MSQSPHQDAQWEDSWQSLERLVDQASGWARADLEPVEFYQRLLGSAVSALAATAAIAWRFRDGQWHLDQQASLDPQGLAAQLARPAHRALLNAVAKGGQSRVVLPGGPASDGPLPGNPTANMLLLQPVSVDGRLIGLLEVLQRPIPDAELQQAYANLLAALGEAAEDYHRNCELRELRAMRRSWEQTVQFACRVHDARRLRETTYTIVNESRRLLGCDRASLAVLRGRRYAVVAVSGVEQLQSRSTTVRLIGRLAAIVAAIGEPWTYSGSSDSAPPELDALLQPYLDETHVRRLTILPLLRREKDELEMPAEPRPHPVGVLVIESFQPESEAPPPWLVKAVCEHSEIALRNARLHRSPPRRAADWLRQRGRAGLAVTALLVLLAVAAAGVLIPADFTIPARGELVPELRRDVFAPRGGEIRKLYVDHDASVERGRVLVQLASPELDLESKRLAGERLTLQQKLLAARSQRRGQGTSQADERQPPAHWSAIERELQTQLQSVQQQLEIIDAEIDRLQVRSPVSGRVQTWDVRRLLEARPVAQGQVLMTIADVDGPWVLELAIQDHHMRHVLAARRRSGTDLDVSYLLKTAPHIRYQGQLVRLGMTTTNQPQQPPHVQAVVAVHRQQIQPLRSGAAVVARIHCGQAPIAYVWLHDLLDALRTWWFF